MSFPERGRGPIISRETPLVPLLLGAACLALYVLTVRFTAATELEAGTRPSGLALIRYGALFGPFVHAGEWWRALTAIFLHGDLLHLLMNGLGLWAVAAAAEQRFGRARTFVIFVVTGTLGEVASAVIHPEGLSIGASGGIFGLMGLCIVSALRRRDSELKARFVPWAIYGLIFGFMASGRIDNAAHVGGLVTGALFGLILGDHFSERRLPGWVWAAVTGLVLAAILGAFALAARTPLPDLVR